MPRLPAVVCVWRGATAAFPASTAKEVFNPKRGTGHCDAGAAVRLCRPSGQPRRPISQSKLTVRTPHHVRGNVMSKRMLWVLAIPVVVLLSAPLVWQHVILRPAKTGTIITCRDCRTVIADQVRVVKVSYWQQHEFGVDQRQGLCQTCAARPVQATVRQAAYCSTCKMQVRTNTVSATVPRVAYEDWVKNHLWLWVKCGRCKAAELLQSGIVLQEQGKYADAEQCYIGASTADPTNVDATRFLRSLRTVHAEDIARANRSGRNSPPQGSAGRPFGGAEVTCSLCSGSGFIAKLCSVCRGSGEQFVEHHGGLLSSIFGGTNSFGWQQCGHCSGKGLEPCPGCFGSGKTWR